MHKNQYIVVSDPLSAACSEMKSVTLGPYHIYAHPDLNLSLESQSDVTLGLIGYVIDPLNPDKSNHDIITHLVRKFSTLDAFFKDIQVFSGRYVLMLKTPHDFIVTGDACHLRQIYFLLNGKNRVITSSPKLFLNLFNCHLLINDRKKALIKCPQYTRQENAWYGDESFDDRLEKLLPNQYLDLNQNRKKRVPLFPDQFLNEKAVIEYTSHLLKGTFSALASRYELIQPLTAGWDSRILLAASKKVHGQIKYYTFDSSHGNHMDVRIPLKLSHQLGFAYECVRPHSLRDDFLKKYEKEHILPRILPKTANIQYHLDCQYHPSVINVNGNGAEVVRCFYGHSRKGVTLDMLFAFSGYNRCVPYITEQIEKWYSGAREFSQRYEIPLLDLFYWEQRMGNWGALFPHEQDIAVEEVSPFNNLSFLTSVLSVRPERRKSPHFSFFRNLIHHLWKEVLSEPINPDEILIKQIIKGDSRLRYYALKVKACLSNHG